LTPGDTASPSSGAAVVIRFSGISSANAADALTSRKPDVRRFVGVEGGLGKMFGLDDAWAILAVTAAGNYSEIYERNLGVKSRLGIPRRLNQL
jgi:general L-amino acid transport system substrate-binding protein